MIKPPNWAKDAIPKNNGWFSPSGEFLKSQKLSTEQIDKFYSKNASAPSVLVESPINKPIEDMTKKELEETARHYGIELDRRYKKKTLIEKLGTVFS